MDLELGKGGGEKSGTESSCVAEGKANWVNRPERSYEVMNKVKFSKVTQPFICCVLSDKTPADCIRSIKLSDYDGADAYELNLMILEKQYLNEKDLGKIFKSTEKPIIVCHYRWDYERPLPMDEEKRVKLLVDAVRWGASGVDLEADAFDPSPGPLPWSAEAQTYWKDPKAKPRDYTTSPEVIKRQKQVMDEIHRLGGEVLMSVHSRIRMPAEQCVAMAKEIESRGADVVKLVRVDVNYEDFLELLRATVELKKVMKVPFIMMSHGQHAKPGRLICPMLGSMLVFGVQPIAPGAFPLQPPIKTLKAVLENVDWSVTLAPEEQNWL
jgi:3-dehydroquinate dehydratase